MPISYQSNNQESILNKKQDNDNMMEISNIESKCVNLSSPPRMNIPKFGAITPNDILDTRMFPNFLSPCSQAQFNRPSYKPSSQIFSPYTPINRNFLSPFLASPEQSYTKRNLFTPLQYIHSNLTFLDKDQ